MRIGFRSAVSFSLVFLLCIFLAGAFTGGASFAAYAQGQTVKPLTLKSLLVALRDANMTPAEYIRGIQKHGVTFEVTADVEYQLRQAGATPAIIQAARDNYRGAAPSPAPAPHIAKTETLYGAHGISPDAVRQGRLGSCYFHATIAALARISPDTLRDAIRKSDDGGYRIHFHDGPEEAVYPEDVEFGRTRGYDLSEGAWVAVLMRGYAQRSLRVSLAAAIQQSPSIPDNLRPDALSMLNHSGQLLVAYDRAIRSVVSQSDDSDHLDKAALKQKLAAQFRAMGIPASEARILIGFLDEQGFYDALTLTVKQNGEVFGAYKSMSQGGIPARVIQAFMGGAGEEMTSNREKLMEQLQLLHSGSVAMVAGTFAESNSPESQPGGSNWFVPGHAFSVMGYDSVTERVSLRNPWGEHPAPNGSFTLPLETFLRNYEDFFYSSSSVLEESSTPRHPPAPDTNEILRRADAFYDQKRYAEAAPLYDQLCNAGNAVACGRLGYLYDLGEGVGEDDLRAVALYTKACDGNSYKSCNNLGVQYVKGKGIAKDPSRAAMLFSKACNGKYFTGCSYLGLLYLAGEGVGKDVGRGRELLTQGCNGGDQWGCDQLKELQSPVQPSDNSRDNNQTSTWKLLTDNNLYRISVVEDHLYIQPIGSGLSADLKITTDKKGNKHFNGRYQIKSIQGYIGFQEISNQQIHATVLVPKNGASDPDACLSRTSSVLDAFAAGLNNESTNCGTENLVWIRQ
jgi:hypothetical protein